MELSEALLKLRLSLGESQATFASKLYKNQRTISSYERASNIPPSDFLLDVAKEFNVSLEITPNGVIFKEIVDMNSLARKEILNYIVNNMSLEDFREEELFGYDEILTYKDKLPNDFDNIINSLEIDKDRIVGAITRDEYSQLCIYYMGDCNAIPILYCSEDNNKRWLDSEDKINLNLLIDDKSKDRYTYYTNELWIVYLQRDIESISDSDLISALYSCLFGLIMEQDDRIYNLKDINIDLVKEYTEDYSFNKDRVKVWYYKEGEKLLIDIYDEQDSNNDIYSKSKKIIDIPSEKILLCPKNHYDEYYVIVTPDMYIDLYNNLETERS